MLPDPRVLLSLVSSYEKPTFTTSERRRMTLNFLFARAYLTRKRREYPQSSIDPRFAGATSPINADTGAHYTTSPSYANYVPP